MPIPKYILHPTLLLAGGGLILWAVWVRTPSPEEVTRAGTEANVALTPLPDASRFDTIRDLSADGRLTFQNSPDVWRLDDARFHSLSDVQLAQARKALVGKKIELPPDASGKTLRLPIELYDSLCFTSPRPEKLPCPIVLQP